MEGGGSVGLQNAPVTKFLLGSIVLNSTLASVLDIREFFALTIPPSVWSLHEVWRLGTWQMFYQSFGEVLFGSLALYKLATTERFMGSRRYAAFVFMAWSTTSLLVPALLGLCVRPFTSRVSVVACGMTSTIFAILFQFHALVPSSPILRNERTRNQVVAPPEADGDVIHWQDAITDKVWMYALAGQLATSRMPSSFIGAAAGWFIGALYHAGYLPKGWRLPSIFTGWIDERPQSTIIRERDDVAPEARTRQRGPARHNQADIAATRTQSQPVQAPSEAEIENLMSMMNVSREVVIEAWNVSGGSFEATIDNLLASRR